MSLNLCLLCIVDTLVEKLKKFRYRVSLAELVPEFEINTGSSVEGLLELMGGYNQANYSEGQ